jgi:hypothetical protein
MARWNPDKPYNNTRWRKLRAWQLAHYPLCALCHRSGRITPATVVDHIVPHNGDPALMWDVENLQSLCASCHSGIKRVADIRGHSQACDENGMPLDANHHWAEAGLNDRHDIEKLEVRKEGLVKEIRELREKRKALSGE